MTIISPRYLDHLALSYALDALELQDPKQTQIAIVRIENRMKSYRQDAPDRATAKAGPVRPWRARRLSRVRYDVLHRQVVRPLGSLNASWGRATVLQSSSRSAFPGRAPCHPRAVLPTARLPRPAWGQ